MSDELDEFANVVLLDKEGKFLNEKEKKKTVRKSFLIPFQSKSGEISIYLHNVYRVISREEMGEYLEDIIHIILYRLNAMDKNEKEEPPQTYINLIPELQVPQHSYSFKRKREGPIDFVDSKLLIECKNWSIYGKNDTMIEKNIISRFKGYKRRKALIIPSNALDWLADRIKSKNIEIYYFKTKLVPSNIPDNLNRLLEIVISMLKLDIKNIPDLSDRYYSALTKQELRMVKKGLFVIPRRWHVDVVELGR